MRIIILISMCLLWGVATWGQQKPQKQDSFSTMLQEGDRLFKVKNIGKSIKAYNVARILAGTNKSKNDTIDQRIEKAFYTIEKQKQDAIKSEQKAKIATNDATALYWASEAEKLKPELGKGLVLLKKASSMTKKVKILKIIKGATESIFNQSNTHKFIKSEFLLSLSNNSIEKQQDRWKIVNEREYLFLPKEKDNTFVNISLDKRWLLTKNEGLYKLWEIAKAKENKSLSRESDIIDAAFSPDSKWLLTRTVNETKLWDISKDSVIAHNFLLPEKGINTFQFSPDSKWLLTRNTQFKIKLWEMAKEKNFISPFWEYDISDAQFSSDSKWLKTQKGDKVQLLNLTTSQISVFLSRVGDYRYFSANSVAFLFFLKQSGESNILEITSGEVYDTLKQKNIYEAKLSNDKKKLYIQIDNDVCMIIEIATGKVYNFLSKEKDIIDADFSPDSKFLLTKTNEESKLWEIDKGIAYNFLSKEKGISYSIFSPDSKWLITRNSRYVYKIWQIPNGDSLKFQVGEKPNISDAYFSSDSKYLFTTDRNNVTKRWGLIADKAYQKSLNEKNTNNGSAIANSSQSNTKNYENGKKKGFQFSLGKSSIFTKDSTILCTITNHQVKTYKVSTGELIQTLWLNKKPTKVQIIDNRYLYVIVGNAIVKTDLQTQKGNLMSFGDGEPLDYQYDEIMEWEKAFGKEYLLPLDEEIKKKYDIK